MGFQRVRFYQFRNLHDGYVDLPSEQVFLVGENGQGKSNFLESLYLLSYGASFRTRRDGELCRVGEREMAIDGLFSPNTVGEPGRTNETAAPGVSHQLEIRWQENRKKISLDGEVVHDRRDMVSLMPSVVFRHDDMNFVSGPPDMQRWFVDQTLSMYEPRYIDDIRRYRAVLRNRNHAIKEGMYDLMPVYDQELATVGLEIQRRRSDVIQAFNTVFGEDFQAISGLGSPMTLDYRPSWRELGDPAEVIAYLEHKRDQEAALRTTTSGPHRDRVLFRYEGRDFLTIASTGQQRLLALILRVAQARFFAGQTGRLPVLLLDDVLLELDPGRRARFVDRLPPSAQRIFTFLPGEPYGAYRTEETLIYFVRDGQLRAQ
ncbi:MAG TPA: DNA replication and repair protein RecF [Alkalispirochaeta sp.]|nr:DNA replication and repair protein RecF [Alkalispirochaeta sp.]